MLLLFISKLTSKEKWGMPTTLFAGLGLWKGIYNSPFQLKFQDVSIYKKTL